MKAPGLVSLVGAGPGDPGLFTLRGVECLQAAEVCVYDRLADQRLLAYIPEDAELIYVGKQSSRHTLRQDEINAVLAEKALEGKRVVRLKGGDPFVFGRGGEEAEYLVERGIPFEVVPGVTSAIAVPAYAGIPVTQRGVSSSLAVITGHEDPGKADSAIDWQKLATGVDTLVFLMGVEHLTEIVAELVRNGRSSETPAALVRWGTRPNQQTLVATLADVVEEANRRSFGPPAVLVVGEVVSLREKLRWFDTSPLFGKRVLVTRTREQASALSALLSRHGAEPVELPTISIEPVNPAPLRDAMGRLDRFSWVVFTSANAVDIFFRQLDAMEKDGRALASARICAIGPATAAALKARGLRADYVPDKYIAESIVEGLASFGLAGARILLPRAAEAREMLVEGLAARGAEVEEVTIYRAVTPEAVEQESLKRLRDGEIDIVTFTSSSTVRNLVKLLDGDVGPIAATMVACIGPITADTARELGLRVDVEAAEHSIPGLVEALCQELASREGKGGIDG